MADWTRRQAHCPIRCIPPATLPSESITHTVHHKYTFLTFYAQNAVRRAMGQFYYPSWNHSIYPDLEPRHIYHCIDSLRQSLMCSSDITPLVWGWNKKLEIVQGRVGVVHECRNFDKITEWTKEHAVYEMFDQSVWVPGGFVLDDGLL